jgi:hypothetical protein
MLYFYLSSFAEALVEGKRRQVQVDGLKGTMENIKKKLYNTLREEIEM